MKSYQTVSVRSESGDKTCLLCLQHCNYSFSTSYATWWRKVLFTVFYCPHRLNHYSTFYCTTEDRFSCANMPRMPCHTDSRGKLVTYCIKVWCFTAGKCTRKQLLQSAEGVACLCVCVGPLMDPWIMRGSLQMRGVSMHESFPVDRVKSRRLNHIVPSMFHNMCRRRGARLVLRRRPLDGNTFCDSDV